MEKHSRNQLWAKCPVGPPEILEKLGLYVIALEFPKILVLISLNFRILFSYFARELLFHNKLASIQTLKFGFYLNFKALAHPSKPKSWSRQCEKETY
jgi:hypothetical protein